MLKLVSVGFMRTIFLLVLLYTIAASSCLKQSAFSRPVDIVSLDSIISIKDMRKWHKMGEVELIEKSYAIQGVVIANDEHDNLYKSICIQDSTGGIMIQLSGTSLYQTFPLGALVKVRLQQLKLTDYRRMLQIVASVDTSNGTIVTEGIPLPLFEKHISVIKDLYPIEPMNVSYKNLGDSLQGRLIRISNVEFSVADTLQTFADKKNKIGASRGIKFCSSGTIYLRTSGYADFAGVKIPGGNGEMIGVYSVYNYEKQILIRDTSDILFTGKRCTGAAWLQKAR